MLRYAGLGLAGALALALVWVIWPARIDPEYWDEPEPPAMAGPLAANDRLSRAEVFAGAAHVEGLLPDQAGGAYVNGEDGELWHFSPDGSRRRIATLPANRLISLDFMRDGRIVAAGGDGLYAIDPQTGAHELLSQGAPARPFGFVNDVAVGPDGLIYFTDSTIRWARPGNTPAYLNDMLENRPHGLVLCYDPATRRTRVIAEQLYYPNGVTISPEGDHLLVAETYRYQLRRIWLSGPRVGGVETFAANLPGMPDGVAYAPDGRILLGMSAPRLPSMRWMHRNPWLLSMLTKLPEPLWRNQDHPRHRGYIAVLNGDGAVIDSLQTQENRFGIVSNVAPGPDGGIWFGSLTHPLYGRLPAQDAAPDSQAIAETR